MIRASSTTTLASTAFSLSRSLCSRGFSSQPAAAAAEDSSYDNQPAFDEDEEVTVCSWLQDYRRGVLQPRVVPFQVSVDEAKREFERWHANSSWLSPSGLLKGAVAGPGLPPDSATAARAAAAASAASRARSLGGGGGTAEETAASTAAADPAAAAAASTSSSLSSSSSPPPPTINAVLLPFWLFETAVHVDYRAQILVGDDSRDNSHRSNSNSSSSSSPSSWRDTGWRSRGYREYPWTLSACQVCATYGVRRDLAKAAAVPGVLGRSRPLRAWEASAGRAVDVGWAGSCGASGRTKGKPSSSSSSVFSSAAPASPYSSAYTTPATATGDSGAPLAPRDVRQSVAWALALRSIRTCEVESAARLLEREVARRKKQAAANNDENDSTSSSFSSPDSDASSTSSDNVKDVRVRIRPLKRRARVVYLPAYVLTYSLGERIGAGGSRQPATFQALVSGLDATSVAGERHLSPLKVQAVAGAGAAALALVAGMSGSGVPAPSSSTLPLDPVTLAFWSFLAVAAGGVAARAATHVMREADERERLRSEEEAFERAAAAGLGPMPNAASSACSSSSNSSSNSASSSDSSEEDLAAAAAEREAGEWRRWEDADRWSWDGAARGAWADALVREQARRRLESRRLREAAAAAAARAAADAAAEGRRRERFGGVGGGGFDQGSDGSSGFFSWTPHSHSTASSVARDHLGYYRALGLSAADSPSPEDVRLAFRSAAFRLHPDRVASRQRRRRNDGGSGGGEDDEHHHHHHNQHHLGDAPGRARAAARFARVRAAYEVLRDPARRADYDAGGSGAEMESGGGHGRSRHRRWY